MTTITVWCENAGHPAQRERVFVAEFDKPNILWTPKPQRRNHPGVKWWQDEDGTAHVEPDAGQGALLHHTMACRFCKRPLTVRVGKLDAVLDMITGTGHADITMSELRAILETSRRVTPS